MKVCIGLLLDWQFRDWPSLKIDLSDCHEEITASSSQVSSNPSKFLDKDKKRDCIFKKLHQSFLGLLLPFALAECLIKVIKGRFIKNVSHDAG